MAFTGPFEARQAHQGREYLATKVDDEVAKLQKPHEGKAFDVTIDHIEPEHLYLRPSGTHSRIDPDVDYAKEPATLVVFSLADVDGDKKEFTITKSAFDKIPLRTSRDGAFAANDGGLVSPAKLIEKYLAHAGA